MQLKFAVITSTTRPTRMGSKIAGWLMTQLPKRDGVTFDLIDLAELNLPLLDEPKSPMQGEYEHEHTKKWSEKIAGYDGYIWLTAEYNYGPPAPLKNAIDSLYHEWSKKPVSFVSYGGHGGVRAVVQLVVVASQLQMMPLASSQSSLRINDSYVALDDAGHVKVEHVRGNIDQLVDDLIWWAKAIKTAKQPIKEPALISSR